MNDEIKDTQNDTQMPSKRISSGLIILLGVVFLIAIGLTAYLTFTAVRDFVTSFEMAGLPGVALRDATATPDETGSGVVTDPNVPLQPVTGPTPPPWDGANRVTILVMGLDYRDWLQGEGPPRTDTMVLLTIDPLTRTAGIMSVPRDLWVNIPGGFKYGRINTAYQLGEAYKFPEGGGAGLAMDTVEELLGVPIDYYALVDFSAFVRFVDELGGVKLDIKEPITIDLLGAGSKTKKKLKPGEQVLPGEYALAYARARNTEGGDFDRAKRTQEVIMGIRDRVLEFDLLPKLIAKSGILYNEISSGIRTNLSLDEAIRLAWLAIQIPRENIKQGVIGPPEQVSLVTSPDGTQQVLKPITDKIRLLRDEIFTNTGPASPAAANLDQASLVQEEGARVAIYNGSYIPGLAANTSDYLRNQGLNVTVTDNAQKVTPYTEIVFYTGKPYTVQYLVDLMNIDPIRIFHVYDPASPVDIAVTLGDDWANNNQMP
jgi:LCP family protein required for cell wall assembly